MREPRRLIDAGGGTLAESLRQARDHDAASERDLDDAWRRLSARMAQDGTRGAGANRSDENGARGAGSGKLLRMSNVIGAVVVTGAIAVLIAREPKPVASPSPVVEHAAPAVAPSPGASAEPRREVAVRAVSATSAALDQSADAPPQSKPAKIGSPLHAHKPERVTAPVPEPDPGAELELIARAQRQLERDPAAALAILQDHARRFPAGVFVQEREIMRIDAELARGQRALARERARSFTAAYPASPHRRRLQALLAEPAAGDHKTTPFPLPTE